MARRADFQTAVDQFSNWRWRLNNLYWITDKSGRRVRFEMNWTQMTFFEEMHYLNVLLKGMAGFQSLQYMGADVIFDGGSGGGAPLNQMFFLNTKYLFYRPHRDRDMAPIGDERMNTNQDAFVQLMGFAGNLTMNNAFLQGELFA
ncbi:hypothetical protein HFN61_04960 [Rhizobium leguminosarum]|nr:hypothetical protein [Rhizobium leguminosarum]